MTALLCIRHAESTMNAARRWQGQADPPLSEAGQRQAEGLAERLAGEVFDALVTSDLERARQTAAVLGKRLGLEPVPWPALREMDVGAWSGLLHDEIARRWPDVLQRFRAGSEDERPGGGESRRELRTRASDALRQVCARWPGGRVAVVTHMGVLRSLVPGLQLENAGTLWLDRSWLEPGAQPGAAPSRPAAGAAGEEGALQ